MQVLVTSAAARRDAGDAARRDAARWDAARRDAASVGGEGVDSDENRFRSGIDKKTPVQKAPPWLYHQK